MRLSELIAALKEIRTGRVFHAAELIFNGIETAGGVPTSRAINTTSPITGGGDLSADRTLGLDVGVDHSFAVPQSIFLTDTFNGLSPQTIFLHHRLSSGSPVQHFGTGIKFRGDSTTTQDRDIAEVLGRWWDATDATREGYIDFQIYNQSAGASKARIFQNGSMSVGGIPPKPTNGGVINALLGFAIGNTAPAGHSLIGDGNEYVDQDIGAWTVKHVTGSDAATTSTTLVDITGLSSDVLAVSTTYEFEAVLFVATSADTNGTKYGVNCSVSPTFLDAVYYGPTTTSLGSQAAFTGGTSGSNIPQGVFLTTASSHGVVVIKGYLVTAGSGSPVLSVRHLKQTSGTSTVKRGSVLKYRKVST